MTNRKILLIVVIVLSLLLVAVVGGMLLLLDGVAPEQEETTQTTTEETTLPPPTENVFTPFDFAYEGDYLTCLTQESMLGIDVSTFQREIDWQQVKDAGIEYAMIRVGFRGYGTTGSLNEDARAQENYKNATAAGVKVGAYFFSQATTVAEAKEEARYVLDLIKDWELQMPVAFDWECLAEDYRTVDVDSRTLTDCAKAFCDEIENAGYDSMIYFNPEQSRYNMHLEELVDYGFWLAMYSEYMTYEYKIDMWQYTKEGAVPGITGNVDINLYFPYDG